MATCWRPDCQMDATGKCPRCAPTWQVPIAQPKPHGCICPPGAEKTCEGPLCPRRNPFARRPGEPPKAV